MTKNKDWRNIGEGEVGGDLSRLTVMGFSVKDGKK